MEVGKEVVQSVRVSGQLIARLSLRWLAGRVAWSAQCMDTVCGWQRGVIMGTKGFCGKRRAWRWEKR